MYTLSVFTHYQVLLVTTIKVGILEWAGRVVRVYDDTTVVNVLLGKPDGRSKAGRPKFRWSYYSEAGPSGRAVSAARLLRSWVRIPPGAWMFVCCECCVLSGRGLCDELITRPESPTDCGASLCVI